ncbi:putative metal-dependent phosphoesterase TrpH [Nakamurella sp. UYEF19]|uniref:PHP domain-containing protein n=1 Tax=Nakamurella sp. UYEF19 TaxID=1756392 RepID=UPI0033974B41
MLIDLHTHSDASDGTDTPAELVEAAARAGVDVLAITDHDTTGGWEAAAAALPSGLTLIRGSEFSTQVMGEGWAHSVHLLGYLFDPTDTAIVDEQARLKAERRRRGLAIVDRMAQDGLPITGEQVLAIAGDAPVGRPHIGRALVASGVVASVDEAFATHLSGRAKYYVQKVDTDLFRAVGMIRAAGGASIIAHPRGRGEQRVLTPELIGALAAAGLTGLEVDHPDHTPAQRAELREIAAEHALLTTGSSDYHGHNKKLRIAQETTDPEVLAALIAVTGGVTLPLGPVPLGPVS